MPGIPADPATLLDNLDPEQIIERLQELDRESRALRILLRVARLRERNQRTPEVANVR
jgi:hypothetical protein